MLLLGLAVAPGLAICLFIFYRDQYNREPATALIISFILGMLSTIPAVIIEMIAKGLTSETVTGILISSFFFIALVEEFSKFLPLRLYAFTRHSFDEPLDGIIHSVMVGMGFATLENIAYVFGEEDGVRIGLLRMFTSVPAHASFAVIMGYYVGKAKFDHAHRNALLLKGVLLASFFHGAYDSCLFLPRVLPQSISTLLLIAGALASLIVALILSSRLIRLHRIISRQYYTEAPRLLIRDAKLGDVGLIHSLAERVWPQTYSSILSRKQIDYMMEKLYSEASLLQQMGEGKKFIIVYNTNLPVGFASFGELEPGVFKLFKIYVLPPQQGRGTGKFIFEHIISEIRSKGAMILRLNVNRYNTAKVFYERLGFEVVATEDIDIGKGFFMNDYVMEKKLVAIEEPLQSKLIAEERPGISEHEA